MKYIVFKTGGKQYRASEGDTLNVERLPSEKDQTIKLENILLYANDGDIKIGTPFLDGLTVEAQVVDHIRGEKIRVAKFKAKSRYRRVTGHRQALTSIKIGKIDGGKKEKAVKETSGNNETVPVTEKKARAVKK